MNQYHSTATVPRRQASAYWREVIAQTYFQLQLDFGVQQQEFRGELQAWSLGQVSLSRLASSPLRYRRARLAQQGPTGEILVTLPRLTPVQFAQMGRETLCQPGQFILEHGDEPYRFDYGQDNSMLVLKLPEAALRSRAGPVDRFCARHFDTTQGAGQLFSDYLMLITRHCTQQGPETRALMGQQLIDLLATALLDEPSALQSGLSSVRAAHLARIETHVRQRMTDPDLTPERIAAACGISLRYLHDLFRDTGQSVSQWVRSLRLQAAWEQLARASSGRSVAQVAYACGFGDPAQFSTAFRRHFGLPPSQVQPGQTPPVLKS
ncbi:helix-turn-helix domain-containing protein [Amphibiibacter pelophylacis]|uniref:Helix-turn-helix domain-containing protein n=1 Tax=Amphibiibacter pelophylacis TaxID=1799477 RepID=A0ACC6P481_9BURK